MSYTPITGDAMIPDMYWLPCKDGDARAYALMQRHYSFTRFADGRRLDRGNPTRHLFCGPGYKMVLLGADCNALFVWRQFIDDSGQQGVNCAAFRNESTNLSSALILQAEELAAIRWPATRVYTYVNAGRVKSINPGFCFQKAGWKRCGFTKRGLHILEKQL